MNHPNPAHGDAAPLLELVLATIALSDKLQEDYPKLQKRLERIVPSDQVLRSGPTWLELCSGWFGL